MTPLERAKYKDVEKAIKELRRAFNDVNKAAERLSRELQKFVGEVNK